MVEAVVESAQVPAPLPDSFSLASSSPSPHSSTSSPINAGHKRKSTLFNILRRSSVAEDTIPVPRRQSVFDTMAMERRPQKPLEPGMLGGLEEDVEEDPNLPQVQLIPPEDEGGTVVLYPFPNYPPPSLALDNASPPETPERRANPYAPSTPSPLAARPRPQSVASAARPRPSSVYSNNPAWNGMAEGFNLPTAKFSRAGANPRGRQSVIMPKTKTQVVEEQKKRMSQVMEWDMSGGAHGGVGRPVMQREGSARPVRGRESVLKESPVEKVETLSEEPDMFEPVSKAKPTPSSPTAPGPPVLFPVDAPAAAPEPQRSNSTPAPAPLPEDRSRSASPSRRSRTMSLSGTLSGSIWASSKTESPVDAPPLPPMPPIPADQPRKVPRKQKSLKNFFFSSSTPPETVVAEPKGEGKGDKKALNKQRSKPDLRIDTNATKAAPSLNSAPVLSGKMSSAMPSTPALSTGRSEGTCPSPGTPSSATTIVPSPVVEGKKPKLTKKFSLSNMVFKKRSNSAPASDGHSLASASRDTLVGDGDAEGEAVPMVPALPDVYKKEKEAKRSKSETFSAMDKPADVPPAPSAEVVLSPIAITPPRVMSPISAVSVYQTPSSHITHESTVTDSTAVQSPTDSISTLDQSSTSISSEISDVDVEEDILNAQFMQLPSARPEERDTSKDFQQILANAPGRRSEVVVVQEGRRSLEALVVLGPGSVRPNTSSPPAFAENRLSASDSEASLSSFASCASSRSISASGSGSGSGADTPSGLSSSPSLAQTVQAEHIRRGSAESEESQEDEGLVTPVCDSVESFGAGVRERKESASEEFGMGGMGMGMTMGEEGEGEETLRGMGVRKFTSSRKLRPSPPPGSRFAPSAPASSPLSTSSDSQTRAISKLSPSGPPPNRPLPPAPGQGQMVEERKIGSLKFDTLGLNFGNWDEREEMAGQA
ncbi:hypothetical protein IAR50_005663 [Cryptococcus sp. DSM 104548]